MERTILAVLCQLLIDLLRGETFPFVDVECLQNLLRRQRMGASFYRHAGRECGWSCSRHGAEMEGRHVASVEI